MTVVLAPGFPDYDPRVMDSMYIRLLIALATGSFAWLQLARIRQRQRLASGTYRPEDLTHDDVIRLVEQQLASRRSSEPRMCIDRTLVARQRDGWWHVP